MNVNQARKEPPQPGGFVTRIGIPVVSLGTGAVAWLATMRDVSIWLYWTPVVLLFTLLVAIAVPYLRWWSDRRKQKRNLKVAAEMLRPQLSNAVGQILSRSSASQTNTPQHVLHILNNRRTDSSGVDYTPECDHARTLSIWGQSVQKRLRSDERAFDVVASDSVEFIHSYLSFIDAVGRRIDNANIFGEPVEKELGRVLDEWNRAVDHLVATTSHLCVVIGGIGEITGGDYSDQYFPSPERLNFTLKT